MTNTDPAPRRMMYALMITVAAGAGAGRIANASRVYEPELSRAVAGQHDYREGDRRGAWPVKRPTPMPTFSSNDRSRWATVRALVDGDPVTGERGFVVGRRDRPTVLATAIFPLAADSAVGAAGLVVEGYHRRATAPTAEGYFGRAAADRGIIFLDGYQSVDKVLHPEKLEFYSSKPPLFTVLLAGLYWLLQQLTGWTLATHPFAVVRTLLIVVNLVPWVVALALLARLVERHGTSDWGRLFVMATACFATLVTPFLITLNNHTVATCCVVFALYPTLTIWRGEARTPLPYLLAGFFASFAVINELPALSFAAALGALLLWLRPAATVTCFVPAAVVPVAALLATNYAALGQLRPAYSEFGGPWYEYEGSHWRRPPEGQPPRRGIDFARHRETRTEYAAHVLVGHHGLFSLSPVWLLALGGMALAVRHARSLLRPYDERPSGAPAPELVLTAGLALVLTVVVVGFYLFQSDNYGGWTCGLRWLMWLTPLWLLALLPAADRLAAHRGGRWLGLALLAWSVFSVSYPAWNPWRHPWLYNLMEEWGWIDY